MSDLETQARIVHQSNRIRDELKGLNDWEREMKQKEAKRNATSSNEEAFDLSYPVRNQVQTSQTPTSVTSTVPNQPNENVKRKPTIPNAIEKANEFKTRGNDCVKASQYQKAIHYYTEAIRLNKSEPVYYTNRALCYLKQNKFKECVDDCTMAVGLDDKAVKAYYRRMQAIEQMQGDLEAALSDCKMVLRIEPKNIDAQRSLSRLEGSLRISPKKIKQTEVEVSVQAPWSQFEGKDGYESIDFIVKAPHLRSKETLKRIAIVDSEGKTAPAAAPVTVDSNRSDGEDSPLNANIDQTNATKKSVSDEKKSTIRSELVIPRNAAQFYKTWKMTTDDSQKFTVLKGIYNADIGRMLGAQFSLDLLREISTILKSHFIHQNLPIVNILNGIIRNSQMTIISAMMNAEDKLAFTKMIEYMRIRGEDAKKIENIQKTFDDLISM